MMFKLEHFLVCRQKVKETDRSYLKLGMAEGKLPCKVSVFRAPSIEDTATPQWLGQLMTM